MKVKKAIIPVAGSGTRFLPATKNIPKEMLPIIDKPILQYIVEEAVESGIEDIIFITGRGKRAIEDHFDYSFELTHLLKARGKKAILDRVKRVANLARFAYVRQPQPLGDGHALLMADHLIGDDEPVAVMFGDDVIDAKTPVIKQLMQVHDRYDDPVVALMNVEKKDVTKYGIVQGVELSKKTVEIQKFVEKPSVKQAPSTLAAVGRYIITPQVREQLRKTKKDKGGEIRLAGAFDLHLKKRSMYGCVFSGTRYDCGSKIGFLKANIDYGLKNKEVGADLKKYLRGKFVK